MSNIQILDHLLVEYLPLILVILPLLTATTVILYKHHVGYWLATWLSALAMLLGGYLLTLTYHGTTWSSVFTWLYIPILPTPRCWILGFRVDFSSAIMISLTTTISFITHLYALAYMKTAQKRYFIYIGSFVSAILSFFMAESLMARFIGWELISWGSYLLIRFRYQKETAAKNGTKAWLINQLGSGVLLTGILIMDSDIGGFDLPALVELPKGIYCSNGWLVVAKYCLIGGALSKAAQLPWFGWMSHAMTAPAPASALIHTATMVGAGIYLVVGLVPVLGIASFTWVTYLGCLTALMGAYAALTQQHIKQVLAYSTISQMGYATMAISIGACGTGLLHFVTHAFGKACLFLCVGNISRFLGRQQDEVDNMKHMGGLYKKLPGTFCIYLIASASLLGLPGLAGAFSKEAVLSYTWAWASHQAQNGNYLGYLVPLLSFYTAFLTVIYIGRQCYLVFMGKPQWSHKFSSHIAYRTPWLIRISMFILAMGTLGFWYGPLWDIKSNWLLQRLAYISQLASTLAITSSLQHRIALASIIIICLGLLSLMSWQVKSPVTLLSSRMKLPYYENYWNTITSMIVRKMLYLSRLTTQLDHLMVDGWIHGVSVGYTTLGKLLNNLDKELVSGVLIERLHRYLVKIRNTAQKDNLQYSLLWMFVGIGLLLGGIYWITYSSYGSK